MAIAKQATSNMLISATHRLLYKSGPVQVGPPTLRFVSKLYTASGRETTVLVPGTLPASKRSQFCFAATAGFSLVDPPESSAQ